jgi:MFS family permease
MNKKKLTASDWFGIVLIGFAGQLAWAIENNYINLWVYSQTSSTEYITWMTIASAVAATLTTFFMGALSDRLGKRKVFIAGGYIVWGITVFLFGLISYGNMKVLFPLANTAMMVGLMMTIIDCMMTFFGSTANDACFNAHVTDITSEKNRGMVESILSVLPLFANIVILFVGGAIGVGAVPTTEQIAANPSLTSAQILETPWLIFFIVFGIVTTIIGVIAIFLLPKDQIVPNRKESYWRNLVYGFRPRVVKENKLLYITLLAFMAFNAAINAFMPYYMVYFQIDASVGGVGLGSGISFYLTLGIILLASSLVAILFGIFMDKIGRLKLMIPALVATAVGFVCIYFSTEIWSLILSGTLMMSGYLVSTAVLGAQLRDETPASQVGLFQGVRMVFTVLVPMIIGPGLTQLAFSQNAQYVNDYGLLSTAPSNVMFLVALGFTIVALAPTIWFLIEKKKSLKALEEKAALDQTKRG